MTAKPTRYFWIVLLFLLTACGNTSQAAEMTKIQNTALAIAQTGVALSQTAMPTATPTALPTLTPEATATPTRSISPILTPDAIQVDRWKEYEDALVQSILPTYSSENILCEWDILARAGQEVYVWAVCASSNVSDWRPAVIHLGTDGSVHSVELPGRGSPSSINMTFPEEAQAKFSFYTGDSLFNGRLKEMINHLNYRETHPEEPPWIVFLATPIPTATPAATPTPPQPIVPILTPDAVQVERWKEYQTELAKVLLYGYGPDAYKDALCEWDILGRSNQEVYVWTECGIQGGAGGGRPAVIHLDVNGTVQSVEVPEINNSTWDSQIQRMFPEDVRNKFDFYTGKSLFVGRVKEMMNHIDYRQTHPEEPPLVVLSATPAVSPTP